MTREIVLSNGAVALVDDADYEWLNHRKWHVTKGGGYVAWSTKINGKNKTTFMHRLILNPPPGMQGDHINGNKLDNRRGNLRVCTGGQNSYNRKTYRSSTSHAKGVVWYPKLKKWRARISVDGKRLHLGYFENKDAAAAVYQSAAREHYGEFARMNGGQS